MDQTFRSCPSFLLDDHDDGETGRWWVLLWRTRKDEGNTNLVRAGTTNLVRRRCGNVTKEPRKKNVPCPKKMRSQLTEATPPLRPLYPFLVPKPLRVCILPLRSKTGKYTSMPFFSSLATLSFILIWRKGGKRRRRDGRIKGNGPRSWRRYGVCRGSDAFQWRICNGRLDRLPGRRRTP